MSGIIPNVRSAFVYINDQDRVLLLQEGGILARGLWSLPGGHLNDGETFEIAAVREALEESGLKVKLKEPIFGTMLTAAEYKGSPEDEGMIEVRVFKAEVVGGKLTHDNEAMGLKWFERS